MNIKKCILYLNGDDGKMENKRGLLILNTHAIYILNNIRFNASINLQLSYNEQIYINFFV